MQQKLQDRAFEHVAAVLGARERTITATRATVGRFSSGRFEAVAGQAQRPEGFATVAARSRQFVVLTDRRLIFLDQSLFGGPGKRIIGQVPRAVVSLTELSGGAITQVKIAFGTGDDGVALTFPRVDKKNAETLAAALREPVRAG